MNKRPYEEDQNIEQFDFIYSDSKNTEYDLESLFERLVNIKQQLNGVKALLSDKDITDWNRFEGNEC